MPSSLSCLLSQQCACLFYFKIIILLKKLKMMSQQSSQQSNASGAARGSDPDFSTKRQKSIQKHSGNQGVANIGLRVESSGIFGGESKAIASSYQLLQQANVQGGEATQQPADEMLTAVEAIRQRHMSEMAREQNEISPELVKDILEADNTTEFLLLSIQRTFAMKPQQVQQLLSQKNMKLVQACDQGYPIGNYTKVAFWFEYLSSQAMFRKLTALFKEAFANSAAIDVVLVLGAIKCGLYSPDNQVAGACIQLLQKIADLFSQEGDLAKHQLHFNGWFTKIVKQPSGSFLHNSVLQSVAEALEQHFNLSAPVAKLYMTVYQDQLKQLPTDLKLAYIDDIFMLYETMNTILNDLNRLNRTATKNSLEMSTLIQDALVDATEDHQDFALKLKTTNLLIEIWYLYPTIVSQQAAKEYMGIGNLSLKDSFHFVLTQGTQERDKVFRVNVFANAFTLLDRLAAKDNKETSAVYKTLISGLLEHYKNTKSDRQIDQVSTEMILRGFATIFKDHEDVPKHIMLEPFLEQLLVNLKSHKAGENLMTTCELEFLTNVMRDHGKLLSEDSSILMLEYFFAVSQSRPYLTHAMKLSDYIGQIVSENKERSMGTMRFIEQTVVPQSLGSFLAIKREEQIHALQSPLASQHAGKKGRSPIKGSKGHKLLLNKEKELGADRRLKRFNIISLLEKLFDALDGVKNQDNIVDQVKAANEKYKTGFKCTSQGLKHLLDTWKVNESTDRQSRAIVPSLFESEGDEASKRIVAMVDQLNQDELTKRSEKLKKKEIDWAKVREPSNPIALRAVEQYQAAKQKRIEKQNKERVEEAKKKHKQQRLNSEARFEVAKRGMILERDTIMRQQKLKAIFSGNEVDGPPNPSQKGVDQDSQLLAIAASRNNSVAIIKANNDSFVGGSRHAKASKKGFALIDFEGPEEDRERDSVRLVLQKYTGLLRFLFDKYTAKQDIHKRMAQLRSRVINERVMSMAELMKLYRDHNMDHSMLIKHEFSTIAKLINDKLLKPFGDEGVNFSGFVQFFWQSAIFCHQQLRFKSPHETGGKPLRSLLFGDMIQNMVTWFKVAAQSRGHQTVLYDYPELASDPLKAKQLAKLNEQVKQRPEITLPAGFVLAKEKSQVTEYSIPPSARKVIGEKKAFAMELLDEILKKSLGVRLFEPQITLKETQVVKLAIQNKSGPSSFRTINSLSSTNLKPNSDELASQIMASGGYSTPNHHKNKTGNTSTKQSSRLAPASTLQSIHHTSKPLVGGLSQKLRSEYLQGTYDDTNDIYGIGETWSKDYQSEQLPLSRQQVIPALEIYKTENILNIVKQNKSLSRQQQVSLVHHRAAAKSQLVPIGSNNRLRSLTQQAAAKQGKQGDSQVLKRKISHTQRTNEHLLMATDLTADLKATTYELQLSKTNDFDVEPIRQTAMVIEDMLRVVTGDLDKYPYAAKKIVRTEFGQRAQSLTALKSKKVLVQSRLAPGEGLSNLRKHRMEEQQKQTDEEIKDKELKDLQRIKRNFLLKKKIAASYQTGGQRSQNPQLEDQLLSLSSVDIVDPTHNQLDKRQLQKLRSKQLQISQAEREARKKKQAMEGQALVAKEKASRMRAASEAKAKIAGRQDFVKPTEHKTEFQLQMEKDFDQKNSLTAEQKAKNKQKIDNSISRLSRQPVPKPQQKLPSPKVNEASKALVKAQQKRQKGQLARQKMEVYIRKERQEMLAFYLRPDVQTIIGEYDEKLAKFYEKIVRAASQFERDIKRMNQKGYVKGFGETAMLTPGVLSRRDMELIFDTIVNERVDAASPGLTPYRDSALANLAGSLSYEEFKKSIVRVASLLTHTTQKVRMDADEILTEMDTMLETSGAEVSNEWDENGDPIRYKIVVILKQKPASEAPSSREMKGRIGATNTEAPPTKLYDISKLRLEHFHKVLHYIGANLHEREPSYIQPEEKSIELPMFDEANNFRDDNFGGASDIFERAKADSGKAVSEFKMEEDSVDGAAPLNDFGQDAIQIVQQQVDDAEQRILHTEDYLAQSSQKIGGSTADFLVNEPEVLPSQKQFDAEAILRKESQKLRSSVDYSDDFTEEVQRKESKESAKLSANYSEKFVFEEDEKVDDGVPVRADMDDDDEILQSQNELSDAHALTLGKTSIKKATTLNRNSLLGNNQVNKGETTRRDITSDGQFSEYNEVLKSPLLDTTHRAKLATDLKQSPRIPEKQPGEENEDDEIFDQYD